MKFEIEGTRKEDTVKAKLLIDEENDLRLDIYDGGEWKKCLYISSRDGSLYRFGSRIKALKTDSEGKIVVEP